VLLDVQEGQVLVLVLVLVVVVGVPSVVAEAQGRVPPAALGQVAASSI